MHVVSICGNGRGKADAAEGRMKEREGQLSIERYGWERVDDGGKPAFWYVCVRVFSLAERD